MNNNVRFFIIALTLLGLAWLTWLHGENLIAVEQELDRIRGALRPPEQPPPVPPAATEPTA